MAGYPWQVMLDYYKANAALRGIIQNKINYMILLFKQIE